MIIPNHLQSEYPIFLRYIALKHDLSLTLNSGAGDVHDLLSDLVMQLHRKHGKKVVVIIDEYDTPLHNFLDRPEELEDMRNELSKLYGVLKYLTGILKFSNLSLFSKLNNNIEDHSFKLALNSICGCTREELESNFKDHLQHLATETKMSHDELMTKLTTQFDGYRFAVGDPTSSLPPPTVFNPFAINRAIKEHMFEDKWIESGPSGQLVSQILKDRASGKALENTEISLDDLKCISTPSKLSYQCMMYYTGYATIRGYDRDTDMVTLAPPTDIIGLNVMDVIAQTNFNKAKVDNTDVCSVSAKFDR